MSVCWHLLDGSSDTQGEGAIGRGCPPHWNARKDLNDTSYDVLARIEVPFGAGVDTDAHILGEIPENPGDVNRHFQAKSAQN